MGGTVKEARLNFTERFLRAFSYVMVHTVHRPKIYGPKPVLDQPTIFACRHLGLMDPVILMAIYPGRIIRPLVAKDYYEKNGFTRKFYKTAQCLCLDRYHPSKLWLEDSMATLGKGESIIIFPEGRRNKSGVGLLPFRSGVAMLAHISGARIIPVYHTPWKFPHRYKMALGEPFHLEAPPEGVDQATWLKEQATRIQNAVAALEPRIKQ